MPIEADDKQEPKPVVFEDYPLIVPKGYVCYRAPSPITIDRSAGQDAMQQMIRHGRERLQQGFWIVIYPEGTRIRAGTRARYKTGGARLAIGMPAPVLPIAHNAGYLWPKGLFGKRPGTITLSIGPSMSADGKDAAQLTQAIESWIEGEVARLGTP